METNRTGVHIPYLLQKLCMMLRRITKKRFFEDGIDTGQGAISGEQQVILVNNVLVGNRGALSGCSFYRIILIMPAMSN